MKKKTFFSGRPSLVRNCIQAFFLLICLYIGYEFYHFYLWASGSTDIFTPRPAGVEAFLPISALAAAKVFFVGGGFDKVHPAGLVIFLTALLIALAARKSFCGYLCPVGWCTFLLGRLGKKLGISRPTKNKWISRLISVPKYILLALLVWLILIQMPVPALQTFLMQPYNMVADSKMLLLFLEPSSTTLVALGVIFLGSLMVPGFWCRGFCPYGALLGLISWISPIAVNRNKKNCTHCRRCSKACPTRIEVHSLSRVTTPECQGCLECVSACPEKDCLSVKIGYGNVTRKVPFWIIPLLCLLILYFAYMAAQATGNWNTAVPAEMLRNFTMSIEAYSH